MSNRQKVRLKDICNYTSARVSVSTLTPHTYISTENMQPLRGGVVSASSIATVDNVSAFVVGDVLISNIRPYFKKIWLADREGGCSNDVLCFVANRGVVLDRYLYYLLSQDAFFDYMMSGANGSKMPRGDKQQIMQFEFNLPPLEEQERIAKILGSLDDKIELNNKINRNLEAQAEALFKQWFVDFDFPDPSGNPYRTSGGAMIDSPMGIIPDGWRVDSLVEIASYLNGLAMQKFRPLVGEVGIPVLKIKELGQRECSASSDLCSPSIKSEYLINNGDVVFSWSGTLMIDIWCGGLCGLNQHLFKVTSDKYPKWFYYMWTNEHLQEFIRIAKDKAVTMGHIKREHLVKSQVLIPEENTLSLMTNIMSPMFDDMINRRVENRKLTELRDSLLPKLMNNEL